MAANATLSREERIGLGIAALAHVALVAALVWQVRDEPEALPIPERMTVSLADDVALESTAPSPAAEAQASVAPELSPEPAPPVETVREVAPPPPAPRPTATLRPQPRATPTRAPQPRATATRTPQPRPSASSRPTPRSTPAPRPSPSRSSGGSRIGADFLEGSGSSERADRGTPAAAFGPAEAASLIQAISRKIKPHWNAPQGVDAEQLVTVLSFELNSDGSLKGTPRVVSQSGVTDSNRPQMQLHAERAVRAVQLAAPFDLPDEFYDRWKRISSLRFDRRL
jgi:protein TonB